MGSYEGYTEGTMQKMLVNCVQFILDTGGGTGEKLSAKAVGNTSVQGLFDAVWEGQGFRFSKTNLFERKWIVYKD
jgi:hypothetical protein